MERTVRYGTSYRGPSTGSRGTGMWCTVILLWVVYRSGPAVQYAAGILCELYLPFSYSLLSVSRYVRYFLYFRCGSRTRVHPGFSLYPSRGQDPGWLRGQDPGPAAVGPGSFFNWATFTFFAYLSCFLSSTRSHNVIYALNIRMHKNKVSQVILCQIVSNKHGHVCLKIFPLIDIYHK
jgi:hypothetical protein